MDVSLWGLTKGLLTAVAGLPEDFLEIFASGPIRSFSIGNREESVFLPSNLLSSVRERCNRQFAAISPSATQLKGRHMLRKSLGLTIVVGLSLAIFATDVLAQPGGRGGRGGEQPGGGQPEADGAQTPAAGRGPRGAAQASGRFGGGQAVNPLFAALDANSDGVITTAEMEDAVQAFAKLDENKDGRLTADEAGAAGGGHGHMHGRGAAASGASQTPTAGRGVRGGRGGADEGAPAAEGGGRGRGGQGAAGGVGRGGAGGRGAAVPANPPASDGDSKSPFDE